MIPVKTKPDSKYSPSFVERCRELWDTGVSTAEIGRRVGVSKNSVISLARRRAFTRRPNPCVRRNPDDTRSKLKKKRSHMKRTPIVLENFVEAIPEPAQLEQPPPEQSESELPEPDVTVAIHAVWLSESARGCLYPTWSEPRAKTGNPPECRARLLTEGRPYCAEHHALCYTAEGDILLRRDAYEAVQTQRARSKAFRPAAALTPSATTVAKNKG